MAVDARARNELQTRLEQVLGEEPAMTLMEYLPHGSPATAENVDALRQEMRQGFASIDQRFGGIDQRLDSIDQRFGLVDERSVLFEARFDHIDQQFLALRERMDGQYENLRGQITNLDLRLDGFGAQVTGEMYRELGVHMRTYLFATMGSIVGVAGVVAAFT